MMLCNPNAEEVERATSPPLKNLVPEERPLRLTSIFHACVCSHAPILSLSPPLSQLSTYLVRPKEVLAFESEITVTD